MHTLLPSIMSLRTLSISALIPSHLKTVSFLLGGIAVAIVIAGCSPAEPKKSESEMKIPPAAEASSEAEEADEKSPLPLPPKEKSSAAPATTPSALTDDNDSTPAPSAQVVAPAGLRSVHQKLLKEYVSCVKNKGEYCHCKYQVKRMCPPDGLEPDIPDVGDVDLEEVFTLNTFLKESDSDLLDYIPNLTPGEQAYFGRDFKIFAVYHLKTSVEQFNKAFFVYEDGAWKYLTLNYSLGE